MQGLRENCWNQMGENFLHTMLCAHSKMDQTIQRNLLVEEEAGDACYKNIGNGMKHE